MTNVLPAGRMFLFSRSLRMGLRNVRKDSSRSLVILRLDKMEPPCSTTQKLHKNNNNKMQMQSGEEETNNK